MVKKPLELPKMRGVEDLLSMDVESESPTATVNIDKIRLPAQQPRRYFDPEKLSQLVQSVKEHGILQPLLVRAVNGEYELVAGERRLRAAKEAGLTEVPIITKELSDHQTLQIALLENLQREDLNPIEETEGILELLCMELDVNSGEVVSILNQAANAKKRGLDLTENVSRQLEIIESVLSGVGRFSAESFRTSRLPLLNLPDDVLEILRQGKIEYTKARAIAKLKDDGERRELLDKVINENLSLSEIKQLVKELTPGKITAKETLNAKYSEIGKRLKNAQVWEDVKKTKKLEKLLSDLEQLLE
ncbi:MAG: ParB/RepB/Spo0J family partition protein [Dolichospermum sp. DEX189]|jgi:ParB family chromosome partitioning protein|uniref:ParB/RepB/Spo0J family partition protein n=1 Tax=Aphanizomenon flos-aquae FACHB-1040 TaxID=2692887 RepID=A0ABR8BW99_APHFL|nr:MULTISPECIES: ParB/RepB/Spo0J family partition protein [Nostocales]ALB43753.1 plasmid partitioning protein ParB [Anabaena sp. WA102]MBD2278911.1 ParB/RepB/Spo0J family partition protein [Aphanizomenon flos-aquae FACHB-1040]MBO1072909.1 ParB/RepB/Spo0J family partition protein [Dolichospermum sp. DEX189]MTJ21258.1 ParB/RepB/Spo0J family partition protein [Dolichospermum sp. UHCC 0352]